MNERLAAETGGRVLLRIEDLDRTRCKPRVRGRDRRRPRLARASLSRAARRQSEHRRRLRGGARAPRRARPRLSLFLQPLGGRARLERRGATPTARRSTPEPAARSRPPKRATASRAATGPRSASTWAGRSPRRRAALGWTEYGEGAVPVAASRRRRRSGATSSLAGAIWRRAIIWRSSSTMRCRA